MTAAASESGVTLAAARSVHADGSVDRSVGYVACLSMHSFQQVV